MARHVADLEVIVNVRMSADEVESVALKMPRLRRLKCWAPLLPVDGPMLFPLGLHELEIWAFDRIFSAAEINAVVAATSRLEQLQSLSLLIWRIDPLISFAPLAALPLFRLLSINVRIAANLSHAQVEQLRALPRLRTLNIHPVPASLLRRLLAQPHDLQWQRISLPSPLRDADTALLPRLPSLTSLDLNWRYLSGLDFLQGLPNLSSLRCSSLRDGSGLRLTDRLVAALQRCTDVTELHLDRCASLTAAHLAELLPRMPRLRSLGLSDLGIDSLSFLAQAPLTIRLSRLSLSGCKKLPVAELRHVHSLLGLRELGIHDSFDEQMDPDCDELTALRPPSAALPLLESFTYYPHSFETD